MNKFCVLFLVVTSGLATQFLTAKELIANNDFANGRTSWKIDGNVEPATEPAKGLTVNLNARHWTFLRQEIRLNKKGQSNINVKIELAPSADFKHADKADEYTADLDWEQGNYGWSAWVTPKCDFMVVVGTGGWEYRIRKLIPGQDQTITVDFKKLKDERTQFTIAIPPGEGTLTLKLASVDLRD
jgi:hypothetical protein